MEAKKFNSVVLHSQRLLLLVERFWGGQDPVIGGKIAEEANRRSYFDDLGEFSIRENNHELAVHLTCPRS
jgi:hypothetical protein